MELTIDFREIFKDINETIKSTISVIGTIPKRRHIMKQKAENYDKIMSSIEYTAQPIFDEIEDGEGNVLRKSLRCVKRDAYIDVRKMLRSGGFEFDDDVEVHIV